VTTVQQRLDLADRVAVEPAPKLRVEGFPEDTLVQQALESLAEATAAETRWEARIWKRIPVAAGLGGGSSDAATALRLANETLPEPLPPPRLRELATELGADVPFFLASGSQLGEGVGADLTALDLPQDYWVVLLLPQGAVQVLDSRRLRSLRRPGRTQRLRGAARAELRRALETVTRPRDLAQLPPNDLASSPLAEELRALGAFRADVTGAGPAVYGLFHHRRQAAAAERELRRHGRTWLTVPAWYG
jgi:4-diphosphocytidyl-2-C-methyl-D-erythritol kinase